MSKKLISDKTSECAFCGKPLSYLQSYLRCLICDKVVCGKCVKQFFKRFKYLDFASNTVEICNDCLSKPAIRQQDNETMSLLKQFEDIILRRSAHYKQLTAEAHDIELKLKNFI